MPRAKAKVLKHVFSNHEFTNSFFPFKNGAAKLKPPKQRGWNQYRDRNFKLVQKFAPVAPVYKKFEKEVIQRSLKVEYGIKPAKYLAKIDSDRKADYLKMARLVLVFHNYGVDANELRAIRLIAFRARCEWIHDKKLGQMYARHLDADNLEPLLNDGDAILWAAYNTNEFKYIKEKIKNYNYSFKLVAGLLVNPETRTFNVLLPNELDAFENKPPVSEYIGSNLLGPLMAQPYSLTSTLVAPVAQLLNTLQYHLFKLKEKGGASEAPEKADKAEKAAEKPKGEKSAEKADKPAGKEGEKGKEAPKAGGEKKDGKDAAPKAEAKGKDGKEAPKDAKEKKPAAEPKKE